MSALLWQRRPHFVGTRRRAQGLGAVQVASSAATQQDGALEPAIHVYHRTGWAMDVVHGSLAGGAWQDYPLTKVPSGSWHRGRIPLPVGTGTSPKLLEFVLTNKQNNWDKPADGGNFVIQEAGTYAVRDGQVSKVTGRRVMVVSDLDGTMIGDDAATSRFRQWWEDTAIPRGGVLVYNTGRALDSFVQLLKDKGHCLARPDALISAVGTKIYEHDGKQWVEDAGWQAQLDEEWHLEAVREAAYQALAQVGKEHMHFRPKEEQNNHKVTCGVEVSVLQQVLDSLQASLGAKGVRANLISSGHGQWRFLDIVPIRAGKLTALNFVRERYGFKTQETVACGDSGNDILMLQGDNPAIIVGNAQADLRKWYETQRSQEPAGNGPQGKQRLLMVKQHEAVGILEGLDHWGFK